MGPGVVRGHLLVVKTVAESLDKGERDWNAPSGIQWAKITNSDAAGRGVMSMKLEWDGDQLPHFMQWRNACEALYVQGLEPSTTGLLGRDGDNSHAGSSPNIAPGDSRKFSLNFSFNSSF